MNEDFEISPADNSDKTRFPRSQPYVMLRINGGCYINQKAASLLGLAHGDLVRFYKSKDLSRWFLANDPNIGSTIRKASGAFHFCDVKNVKILFGALGIEGKKAFFPLATQIEQIGPTEVPALFIVSNPFNLE